MIEQILIGSCEHQRYRRAAQLAMLENYRYPLDIVDVVWGWHADFYDISIYLDSLDKMGAGYVKKSKSIHLLQHKYSLSNNEVKMRMLVRIVETELNTIMIEDDHFLNILMYDLTAKLNNLMKKASTDVEVVQLYPRSRVIDYPVKAIAEAEDFEHGIYSTGHHMLFVTPQGAENLLQFMRSPKTPLGIENGMVQYLQEESYIYSVVPSKKNEYVKSLKCIQGMSAGSLITKSGEAIRRTDEQIERDLYFIEHFKL